MADIKATSFLRWAGNRNETSSGALPHLLRFGQFLFQIPSDVVFRRHRLQLFQAFRQQSLHLGQFQRGMRGRRNIG